MKYCGIELKSNEARIVSIEVLNDDYEFIASSIKKIKLDDSKTQAAAIAFKNAFDKFFVENNFDKVGIKERGRRGKFAGGADSFKMEGIIQSLNYTVEIIHTNTIKAKTKDKVLKTESINNYQEEALKTALSLI